MDNLFINIYLKGNYYSPASSHYNNETSVVCDRCNKNDLDKSFGYLDNDLVLTVQMM